MTKSLPEMGLPDGFEALEEYVSETDKEEGKIYESWMIGTKVSLDEATARLETLLSSHLDTVPRVVPLEMAGFRIWSAEWATTSQTVTVQLTDDKEYRSGFIRSVRNI
jgi:hypothetical protein